ncbi:MAG: S41 family peptidase [Oscillospiraceae bacterium]
MKKKISVSEAISLLFVAMTVTFCLTMVISTKMFEEKVASVNEKAAMYEKIADVENIVRQNFYTSIDQESIYNSLATGYINGLKDSESVYYSAGEVAVQQEISKGKVIGVGVDIAKSKENNGYMQVYRVYSESPADVEGIVVGDLISGINGTSTTNMTLDEAKKMLTGQSGTGVEITFLHEKSEKSAKLVHKAYDAPSVSYSKEDDVGYIKLTNFVPKTASELEYASNNLLDQGVKSLCIDIRNNKSKDFDSAAAAADVLLKEGTTMYATYVDGEKKVLYTSDKTCVSVPIVLLTNSGTGYGAELFTAMLKDIADAKTVGTTTMGKGTVQKLFRLPDGSGVELTIAVLTPVKSAAYNGVGITPDYEKILDADQEQSYYILSIAADGQIQRGFEVAKNLVNKATGNPEGDSSQTQDVGNSQAEGDKAAEKSANSKAEEKSASSKGTEKSSSSKGK